MKDKEFVSACNCRGVCRCVRNPIQTPYQKKQTFIEWLEKRYSAMSATHPTSYIEGYTDALGTAIDKAKEMASVLFMEAERGR